MNYFKSSPVFGLVLLANIASSYDGVLIVDKRIETIKYRIEHRTEPTYSAYRQLEKTIRADIGRQPHAPSHWYVPGYYRDAEGHRGAKQGLSDDANAAYRLALMYRLSERTECAETAICLINAWATNVKTMSNKDDSMLSFSYHFPAMVFAADLLEECPRWPQHRQSVFKQFVREEALPMNTMDRENNWGNWGLVLVMASAAYLDDESLFKQGTVRWKEFIERQIAEDGHLPHEVKRNGGRSGLWYSNFSLFPQTIAAEIAKTNGTDLYNYLAPNGRTLRHAFEKLAPWTNHPEAFPYWQGDPKKLSGATYVSYYEILNALWPDKDASELLSRLRPLTAQHSLPLLTLTHGTPLDTGFEGKP